MMRYFEKRGETGEHRKKVMRLHGRAEFFQKGFTAAAGGHGAVAC
jgi:hypothetical protein